MSQKCFKIDPFKSLVFPRPFWISSLDPIHILITYLNHHKLFLPNGSTNWMNLYKFCYNLNISSRDFKPDEDEFILSKLKKKKSKLVKAPSVKNVN